jgi:oligoribonuclease
MIRNHRTLTRQPHLLWFDGEFTGLDPSTDLIIEVAAVTTDPYLNVLDEFSTPVKQDTQITTLQMQRNPWWKSRPLHSNAMLKMVQEEGICMDEVSKNISNMLSQFPHSYVYLAGNTIRTDRAFIDRDLPNVASRLHYRMLDVTSLKIIGQMLLGTEYSKKEAHRARADIHESISELRFILDAIGSPTIKALIDPTGR